MSHLEDMKVVFRSAKDKYGLTEGQCAELFADAVGAIEWDVVDVDWNLDGWIEEETRLAKEMLFGERAQV